MTTIALNVSGMTCDGCERSVTKALRNVDGVGEVTASHATGLVEVEAEAGIARDALVAAVEQAGYDVLPEGTSQLPMA
ncbi:MAG TPA: heavy-metal-associated domain-containing protein [Actinomycetota bacterium]